MAATLVRLPQLHEQQLTIARDPARFRVLAAGRRWGKTRLGAVLCVREALLTRRAWWVAPTFPIARIGWRLVRDLAVQLGAQVREAELMVSWPRGGWVQVRSADNPDSLRGEGLDLVVLDEAAYQDERAWDEALRPALADRQGRALFISTPNGLNWFWQLYQRGQDLEQIDWRSWQFPTVENPYIAQTEVEAARTSLPERTFAQEFLAEFITDQGAVFRGVQAAATLDPAGPEAGHVYVVGCDWGKSEDFSVFSVVDATAKRQVYQDRSNRLDYTLQAGRLKALCDRYRPSLVLAERNSIGDPVIEQLSRLGLPVFGWTATNATKHAVVEALALGFEQAEIKVLRDPVLVGELLAFEATRLPSGLMRYAAPEGGHDDCVIALALAWAAATRARGPAQSRDFRVVA